MPQTKEALHRILKMTEQQLAQAEARLLNTLTEAEMAKAIEVATDLQVRCKELRNLLVNGE